MSGKTIRVTLYEPIDKQFRGRTPEVDGEQRLKLTSDHYQAIATRTFDVTEGSEESKTEVIVKNMGAGVSLDHLGMVIVKSVDGIQETFVVTRNEFTQAPRTMGINEFFKFPGEAKVKMESKGLHLPGLEGSWKSADCLMVDGRYYYLLEPEQKSSSEEPERCAVVNSDGEIVASKTAGFCDESIQEIRDWIAKRAEQQNKACSRLCAFADSCKKMQEQQEEEEPYVRPADPYMRRSLLEQLRKKQAIVEKRKQAKAAG